MVVLALLLKMENYCRFLVRQKCTKLQRLHLFLSLFSMSLVVVNLAVTCLSFTYNKKCRRIGLIFIFWYKQIPSWKIKKKLGYVNIKKLCFSHLLHEQKCPTHNKQLSTRSQVQSNFYVCQSLLNLPQRWKHL